MEYNSYNMYAQVFTCLRRAINFELRFLDLVFSDYVSDKAGWILIQVKRIHMYFLPTSNMF